MQVLRFFLLTSKFTTFFSFFNLSYFVCDFVVYSVNDHKFRKILVKLEWQWSNADFFRIVSQDLFHIPISEIEVDWNA